MKRLITIATLVAGVTLATSVSLEKANAQYAFPTPQDAVKGNVQGRGMQSFVPSTGRANMLLPEGTTIASYGTEVSILKEDFSKLTTGTEANPDTNTLIYVSGDETPISEYPVWFNVKEQYTHQKTWGAGNVYPAGGALYMADKQAKINTPLIDVSKRQANFFVRFRAKASRALGQGEMAELLVEAAETFNMSPTWRFGNSIHITDIPTTWKTYEILFQDAGKTTLVNIVKMAQNDDYGVLIDDIEVVQVDAHVTMPELKNYNNYKGTSVNLRWKEVAGADSYLLNVYHMVPTGEPAPAPGAPVPTKREDVVVNQKIEGGNTTSYTLSGLTSGGVYFYNLTAVKGEHKSITSPDAEIYDLEAPVLKSIQGPAVNGVFTATWDKVPAADVYNVWAYYDRTAEKDGEFVITNEDFSNLRDINGNIPQWTPENPDPHAETFQGLGRVLETVQAGWLGFTYAPYQGVVCIDGWHYYNGGKNVSLQSEELDLSKDEGKFKVKVDLWGVLEEIKDQNANVIATIQTEAALALFTYDEELNDFKQVELIYPEKVTPRWTTYEIEFTKGAKRSKLGIFAVKGPGNLYIDNLKITQNYKKDEVFRDPCYLKQFVPETSHEIRVNAPANKVAAPLYARVVAVRGKAPQDQYSSTKIKTSEYSAYEQVQNTVGAEAVHGLVEATAYVSNGVLRIENPLGAQVTVFGVAGETVYNNVSGEQSIVVEGLATGAYVVSVGNEAFKVVL
ncbi:hypothetical protein [Porphyromonas circumdentaria]|uniref:Por secretion system C-terminal sorting domain-containing protein n=1 Tax=Porphyromonas circumdentaria TaxID=29524 RepID=A0A1T4NV75_9PORP|nr:hypothetical protein [Porphyromonas circumdentaria]MBB6276217.1 hypothetical protein [Porphyromonas circumdentaria]SJZ83250.1 hypothetical protein SAMN02745171_01250 [Porphyromonas circumdentaria]